MTKQYLNDLEVAKIEAFCNDKDMYNAVKKILLEGIYYHGTIQKGEPVDPFFNGSLSLVAFTPTNPIPDEIIGQQLKAQWAGLNALHNAFDSLDQIKSKVEQIETPYNEAL